MKTDEHLITSTYLKTDNKWLGLPYGRFIVTLSVILIFFWLWQAPSFSKGMAGYAPLHTSLEVMAVIISFLIFAVVWGSRFEGIDGRLFLLGCMFVGIGLLDFFHSLSYPGMPDFLSASTPGKAIYFWLVARYLTATALFALIILPRFTIPRSNWLVMGATGLLLTLILLISAVLLISWEKLPHMFIEGEGLTRLKIGLEYGLVSLFGLAAFILLRGKENKLGFHSEKLAAAAIISMLSELCFTLYVDVADLFNLLGHIYKIIAYVFIYQAIFTECIRRPYLVLHKTKEQLKKTAAELDIHRQDLEELVEKRTNELIKQQVFTDTVLENIEDGIVACDEHGNLTLFNRATRNLHGIDREDTPQEEWSDHYKLFHEDGKTIMPIEEIPLFRAFKGEKVKKQFLVIEHANGDKRTVICNGQPMLDKSGKKIGAVVSMHDVTFQKLAELELIKSKEAAEAANRTKSRFLANMSHELRTPMHAIHSFTKLALKRDLDPKAKHFLENIDVSTDRLTELLNDLLDLSKLEADKMVLDPKDVEISEIVCQVIKNFEGLLYQRKIKVSTLELSSFTAQIDKKLFFQVLTNLLSNAIKFSPDQSTIKFVSTVSHDFFQLRIEDEGMGIPPNELNDIFDSFVQSTKTMTSAGGTGLGLSITKEIIKSHNGEIWAESPPKGKDVGTVFIIQMPLKQSVIKKT